MHWTNWKGVGNRVARFEESPVVRMKRLLTLNRAGGTLGARGHSPVPDFGRSVNPIPTREALFSHLPPALCIILNMHNQLEFCINIMLILGARSGPKTSLAFWKGSSPLRLQNRWLFWIVLRLAKMHFHTDYLQDLLSWSKIGNRFRYHRKEGGNSYQLFKERIFWF